MTKPTKDVVQFEKKLEKLETIVGQLEQGDLDLQHALKQFETAVTLVRDCQTALTAAEKHVQTLIKDGDTFTVETLTDDCQ